MAPQQWQENEFSNPLPTSEAVASAWIHRREQCSPLWNREGRRKKRTKDKHANKKNIREDESNSSKLRTGRRRRKRHCNFELEGDGDGWTRGVTKMVPHELFLIAMQQFVRKKTRRNFFVDNYLVNLWRLYSFLWVYILPESYWCLLFLFL